MFLPDCCLTQHVGLYFGICTFLPPYLGSWILPAAVAAAAQRLRSFIHIPHKLHSDFEIAAAAAGRAQKADILEAGLGAGLHDGRQPTQKGRNKAPSLAYCKYPSYSTSTCHEDMWGKSQISLHQGLKGPICPFFGPLSSNMGYCTICSTH